MFNKNAHFLTYYNLVLEVESVRRSMGRVNHLQVIRLAAPEATRGITHTVRFWDGDTYRTLGGVVTVERKGERLNLDMGRGKKYHFQKLGT